MIFTSQHHIEKHRAKSFSLSLSLPSTRSLVYLVRIVLTYHTFVNGVLSGRNWFLGLVARFFRGPKIAARLGPKNAASRGSAQNTRTSIWLEQGAQPQQKPAEDAKRRSTRKAPQAAYFFPEKDTGKQQWDEPA